VTSDSKVPSVDENTSNLDNVPSINTALKQEEEIIERIPLYEEDFSISKEVTKTQLHLEKKWINSTSKIEIPTKQEEIFINGRELDSYSHNELAEVFSKIKEKISEAIHPEKNENDEQANSGEDSKQYPNDIEVKIIRNENMTQENKDEKALPLKKYTDQESDKNQIQVSDNITEEEEQQVIPLWGEQLIIDKKIVKIGEVIIKKSKISENRKFDVEVRNEKVTVKYPDGNKEEITGI
jgi:stress response protein YsnF